MTYGAHNTKMTQNRYQAAEMMPGSPTLVQAFREQVGVLGSALSVLFMSLIVLVFLQAAAPRAASVIGLVGQSQQNPAIGGTQAVTR